MTSDSRNGGRAPDLAIFPGIGTHSSLKRRSTLAYHPAPLGQASRLMGEIGMEPSGFGRRSAERTFEQIAETSAAAGDPSSLRRRVSPRTSSVSALLHGREPSRQAKPQCKSLTGQCGRFVPLNQSFIEIHVDVSQTAAIMRT